MDPLLRDDIETSRKLSPATKLAQALDMMEAGIRLRRAALKQRHPGASEEELDRLIAEWLRADD